MNEMSRSELRQIIEEVMAEKIEAQTREQGHGHAMLWIELDCILRAMREDLRDSRHVLAGAKDGPMQSFRERLQEIIDLCQDALREVK